MTFGEPAGRSARGRQRPTAQRRFSEQERQQNTPLPDDVQEWPDDDVKPDRNAWIADVIIAGCVLVALASSNLMMSAGNPFVQSVGFLGVLLISLFGWYSAWNARRERRVWEARLREAERR